MQAASNLLSWLIDHALLVVALSVTATVVGEQIHAAWRRRTDVQGSLTSITGGAAYLLVKAMVSKGLMFGVALAVYEHRLLDLDWSDPVVWVAIFVARDFTSY